MPELPDFRIFVSMMKEEWRLHQSFIGRMGSGLFPLFIFTLTAFLAVFSRYILGNMSLERGMLVIHAASLIYGMFVGGLGNIGEQVMTRRLGQISMLLQLPQVYPVSFRRVMAIFYVKDAVFYMLYTFIPLTAGIIAASPLIGVSAVEMLLLGVTLIIAFFMGMGTSFLVTAVYSRSGKAAGLLGCVILCVMAAVWPLGLLEANQVILPLSFIATMDSSWLLYASAYSLLVSIVAAASVAERYESSENVYASRLLDLEPRFRFTGTLKTLISKEWLELVRSGAAFPVVGGLTGMLLGIYGLIWLFEEGMGILLPFNLISYSAFVGLMGVMTYSWMTSVEHNEALNLHPVGVEEVIKAKVILYLVISLSVSAVYVILIGLLRGETGMIPLGLLTASSTAVYVASVTAYLTGLWTNTLFFDVGVLSKFSLLVIPPLTIVEVSAFWINVSTVSLMVIVAVSVLSLLASKPLLGRVGEKWRGNSFSYSSSREFD